MARPSPAVVQGWLSYIRENTNIDKRCSVADLGASLASGDPLPKNCPTRKALEEIETDLCILGEEATAEMLGKDCAVAKKQTKKPTVNAKKLSKYLDGKHIALRKKVREFFLDPKLGCIGVSEICRW